jgi:hypothetical protein
MADRYNGTCRDPSGEFMSSTTPNTTPITLAEASDTLSELNSIIDGSVGISNTPESHSYYVRDALNEITALLALYEGALPIQHAREAFNPHTDVTQTAIERAAHQTFEVPYPPQLVAETGEEGWAIPMGLLLHLRADRHEQTAPEEAQKMHAFADRCFPSREVVVSQWTEEAKDAARRFEVGLVELRALLQAPELKASSGSARAYVASMVRDIQSERDGSTYGCNFFTENPENPNNVILFTVGKEMHLVADNDERNGNLDSAVKLRTIANRYYFNDDHEVEIERPKGVRAYLFGFQPVSDVEVRELAEATLEWLPGSVHLRPYTKLSQYSHANDLEYQLCKFAGNSDPLRGGFRVQ